MQQYLFDANDAESWMSDQELYMMMVEDRAKDEFSTQNLKKKHEILETSVEEYAETVREAAKNILRVGVPQSRGLRPQSTDPP